MVYPSINVVLVLYNPTRFVYVQVLHESSTKWLLMGYCGYFGYCDEQISHASKLGSIGTFPTHIHQIWFTV